MPLALPALDYILSGDFGARTTSDLPGRLVKIPFRSKEIYGIIKSILPDDGIPDVKIKIVSEIVGDAPFLSPPQLDFLLVMADFYHTSPGFLLKMNLPPLIRPALKKGALSPPSPNQANQLNLQTAPPPPRLLLYKNEDEEKTYISEFLKGAGQKLIIAPTLPDIEILLGILPARIKARVIVINSSLTNKELTAAWIKIKNDKDALVIGTRRAFFLPWHNLTGIMLFDESNPSHKSWDMSPRFHARDAAAFLARSHLAELILLTHTPSVESYFFTEEKIYAGNKTLPPLKTSPALVNLKDERKSGNYGPFGKETAEAIKDAPRGDIFIFINRLGGANYIVCRDCEEPLACSRCGKSLTYLPAGRLLRCNRCHETKPMVSHCGRCGSVNLKNWGVGTQSAEAELKKNLGGGETRPIWRVDSDSETDIKKINGDGDKIIIGTEMAWPHLNWKKINLLVFLEADAPLFIPEYNARENLWRLVRDAAFRLPLDSRFIIQTAAPEHPLWQNLNQPEEFYKAELDERRAFEYPPFSYLTRLLFGHHEMAVSNRESDRLAASLKSLTNTEFSIKITGPLETSPHYQRGKYWKVVLAKIPFKYREKGIKKINEKLSENWKTDPNPNTLLSI